MSTMIHWKLRSFWWWWGGLCWTSLNKLIPTFGLLNCPCILQISCCNGVHVHYDGRRFMFFTSQLPTTPPPRRPKPVCLSSEIKNPPRLVAQEATCQSRPSAVFTRRHSRFKWAKWKPTTALCHCQSAGACVTWVSDAPRWSLCSSWWSSLSPAEPSRWSRPLATAPAITAHRAHGRLNIKGAEK